MDLVRNVNVKNINKKNEIGDDNFRRYIWL